MSVENTVPASGTSPPYDGFRLRALPILAGVILGLGLPFLSFLTVEAFKFVGLPERPQMPWLSDYYFHVVLFCYAYAAILILKIVRPGRYGFRRPEGKSYLWAALILGIILGAAITLFEHWSQITGSRPFYGFYSLTPLNVAGSITLGCIAVAISQETMFRAFLVGFLTPMMPGRVTFVGTTMNGAGIVSALIFALFLVLYSGNFLSDSLGVLAGQFLCYSALGVVLAYWYEKSESLFAPIIGRSAAALTEQALVFALVAHLI